MAARRDHSEDVALSLTMAVVASSPGPLLLLDGQFSIVAASTSFSDAFAPGQTDLVGQQLYALGSGEWDIRQLRSLMDTTLFGGATVDAYEFDLERSGQETRRLIIQARLLAYLDLDQLRILAVVSDVTDARADEKRKDDALRQNSILLQEVRHRVANSLQIIASVLLQNARKTQSDETRGHLQDAHHRVMSVAAMERLLSLSGDGDLQVQAYFTSLCDSIATSMIGEPDRISLRVAGGECAVAARVAVSLGLIVTELVINALKYAFPDGRAGLITVDYDFQGPNWILCVCDDGVGMPADATLIRAGLGTSIVQALARQLQAVVHVAAIHPGTKVSIEHTQSPLWRTTREGSRSTLCTQPRSQPRVLSVVEPEEEMPMEGPDAGKLGKTLMIVEDEALVAISLRDELEDAGYRVLDLTDRHAEAVAVAQACAPDLALVNIQLGGRDDGIGLAENLKALGIPVLLISGQTNRARSAQTAAIGSLPKPYSPADMVIAVAYLLRHLKGDRSLPRPPGLEVFSCSDLGLAPAA